MHHDLPLLTTLVAGLVLAFAFGVAADRLKLSPLVGYLVAGVVVGPFTPGFVANQALASELAELGVILLMFGVGLHFSVADLLSVKTIAIPGALVQIAIATLLGWALASTMDWPTLEGVVFGLALSVASTVVLLRALEERRVLDTMRGKIAIGWLIVEDLVMVLVLVLLPVFARGFNGEGVAPPMGLGDVALALVTTLAKVAVFVAVTLLLGRRLIVPLLERVAGTGSRELFTLAVLALALGVAFGAAKLFGVSFALGAFFAGMLLNESELSHQAASDSLPFRDAFAVLFFVSIGMLFDPTIVLRAPLQLLGVFLIILVGKSLAALLIVRVFKHSLETALTIAVSLAQIGEFSFILAGLGVELHALSTTGRDLILAGAMFSILANPLLFLALDRVLRRREEAHGPRVSAAPAAASQSTVLIGFGRVGSLIGAKLTRAKLPVVVIEANDELVACARAQGIEAIHGNAARREVLEAAGIEHATLLLLAIPQCFESERILTHARELNAKLQIIARAHSDGEMKYLQQNGADATVMGEREIAHRMSEWALSRVDAAAVP